MFDFWYFVPRSGIAFIFLSVLAIVLWNQYGYYLPYPFAWIAVTEIILFVICFHIADRESRKRAD